MAQTNSTKFSKIGKREARFAWGILTFVLFGAVLALTAIPKLKTQYSISQFLPENHPLLKADEKIRKRFFLDEDQPVLLTLELKKGDWLETKRLKQLAQAVSSIGESKGAKGVMSLSTISVASQSGDALSVGTLGEFAKESDRRAYVAKDRFLKPLLLSQDGKRTLVAVSMTKDISSTGMARVMKSARAEMKKTIPDARISVGGVPAIQYQLSELVKTELARFMALGLLACCATLMIVFSSLWSILIPFFAILITNVFVLSFMALSGIPMTVLAVTIPILVSVVVLSLCIHTMLRFVEDVHAERGVEGSKLSPKIAVLAQMSKSILWPNFLTTLTICFGFATLIMMDVPVIKTFGVAVSASLMIAWLCTTAILLPLLAILPVPVARGWMIREANWASLVLRHKRSVVFTTLAFSLVLAFFGQKLHWSARLFDDLPKKEEARIATEEIDRSLGGTIPMDVLIESPKKTNDMWSDPVALRKLDMFIAKLRKTPEVGSAVSLPDLLRLTLGTPGAPVPGKKAAISEAWFMMGMSGDNPLKQFLSSDSRTARISLRLRDVPSDQQEKALKSIMAQARKNFPGAKVTTGGMATTVHKLNNGLSKSLLHGFWEALAVISILLVFVFRSWRWTLMAVLPNLVPAAVLIGLLAITKTPMKPSVALVFSIALGIAFSNTVYLLQRLRGLMKESGRGPAEEIEKALRLEGNPCFFASLCLLAGFSTFMFSEFGINRTFGGYLVISLFFGLIGDLAFLPALVKYCPWILVSTPKAPAITLKEESNVIDLEESRMKIAHREEIKEELPRVAAAIAAFALIFSPTKSLHAAPAQNANAILKNVEKGLISKDEKALIKMKVVESDGSSKERELEIKRKSGAKHQVLVRLKSPADVSGIAVLSVMTGKKEDQWLYMPSQKKARRVVSGNKSAKILDTEFSVEDFSASTYSTFENKIVKEERAPSAAVAVIESKNKGAASTYSKIMTWVDLASYQIQKSEYYDRDGKLLKTMVFRDYKKFGSAWRAQTIEVRNMQNRRSTVLKLAGLKVNTGLSDREFTQNALEEED